MGDREQCQASSLHPRTSLHPRRPPSHLSVSLMRSPSKHGRPPVSGGAAGRSRTPASDKANPSSSGSSRPGNHKQSSGESSNAEKWFESSNNNVGQSGASFLDNEPPFFLRNSSSSETPPDMQRPPDVSVQQHATSLPYRTGSGFLANDGSSTEEFRSVIDDLTVENQKLKRRLKKYETLHDSHLQEDKLFEVRIHGLPAKKKKELEETLRKFALSIEDIQSEEQVVTSADQFVPRFVHQPTASSLTSRFEDSAYASMSASGPNSTAQSGRTAYAMANRKESPQKANNTAASRRQNIQSYLHDIPQGLLPTHSAAMTEKSKKKLVVRRLEQIFAGKGAAHGGHQQPMQQEEVAQSAAKADRTAIERSGRAAKAEGLREARIMPKGEDGPTDPGFPESRIAEHATPMDISGQPSASASDGTSPDQRPTRPLDLDPHRAQVPAENIEYIRHLGFSPNDLDSTEEHQDGHGWIYLNLLTNMAQLHTINVTAEFVRKAVTEYSSKLELSQDGRKVRWKGGRDVTRTSSNESLSLGRSNEAGNSSADAANKMRRKRPRLGHTSEGSSEELTKDSETSSLAAQAKKRSSLSYTPLFYRQEESDEDDLSAADNASVVSSQCQNQPGATSSAFASSGVRTSSSKKRRGAGPIIFYNKAKFCTDLSGDRSGPGLEPLEPANYSRIPTEPIGIPSYPPNFSMKPESEESKGPLAEAADISSRMDIDESYSSSDGDVRFASDLESKSYDRHQLPSPYRFEASGVGGVQPDDNFAINVQYRHIFNKAAPSRKATRQIRKAYPTRLQNVLRNSNDRSVSLESQTVHFQPPVSDTVISITRQDLPASELPPASFFPFGTPSDETDVDAEDGSDLESTTSEHPAASTGRPLPTPATQVMDLNNDEPAGYSSDEDNDMDEDEDEDDNSSDGSLDFLATAREIDPATVRAREREYDSNIAERLAEEIPAGSSAATAGGGSGFNSPVDGDNEADDDDEGGRGMKDDDDDDDGEDEGYEDRMSSVPATKGSVVPKAARPIAGRKRPRTNDVSGVHGKSARIG